MSAATKVASSGHTVVPSSNDGNVPGETVLKGRRGTLYHLSSTLGLKQKQGGTLGDITARRRFSTSRYFISPAGLLKVLLIILFLVAGTLFLTSDSCPEAPSWYSWLYPFVCLIAFITTAFLYAMFMLGLAEDNPSIWVKIDLTLTLLVAIAVAVISILNITECNTSHMSSSVLGPVGLTGAALMVVSTAATYIMWRYRDQDLPPATPSADEQRPRVSVFI